MFVEFLWVLLLGSLLGLELIGKVPPTLHTPLMSGANAISGITVLAALTLIIKADGNTVLLVMAHNRPQYLERCLDALARYHPGGGLLCALRFSQT